MDRQIIIPRSKWVSFRGFLFMFLLGVGLGLCAFVEIPSIGFVASQDAKVAILKILSIPTFPICLLCSFMSLIDLFKNTPVLTVNEKGITDSQNRKSVGLIYWMDIEKITKIHLGNVAFITIHLRNPLKYLKDEKELEKIRKKWPIEEAGEVVISTEYFQDRIYDVMKLMEHYLQQYNRC